MLKDQGARHDLVDAVLASGASPPPPPSPGPMSAVADIGNSLAGEGKGEGAHRTGQLGGDANLEARRDPSPHLSRKGRGDFGSEASSAADAPGGEGASEAAAFDGGGACPANDDLLLIVRRVEALSAFLATPEGANLLAGVKRAANILRAEEKKDGEGAFAGAPGPSLLRDPAEQALHAALASALPAAQAAIEAENFAGALSTLAALRGPVDAFFEGLQVNAPEPAIRLNRLRLLAQLREATRTVADFNKIAG
jgi:glycyl-tRNA synthetase beta chain